MIDLSNDLVRESVREHYGLVARGGGGCCGGGASCGPDESSRVLGYGLHELAAVPDGSNLGLGCGNPQAIAALKPGETVLDLGSGAGFDCFLAARSVGPQGKVVGVDMTHDMLARARQNAVRGSYTNVEFRLGEIEHLPVADGTVDVVMSNCVINLSPDKGQVFREAFRVLRSGGRLAISDMVASGPLPESFVADLKLHSACLTGAATVEALTAHLQAAGFAQIRIAPKAESRNFVKDWVPGLGIEDYVLSATIEAVKP